MKNYSNLTIDVSSAADGKLRIRATSDQGEAKSIVSPVEVEKLTQVTKGVMRSSRAIGKISPESKSLNPDENAKDLGFALYNALFQGKIGNMLSRTDATAKMRDVETGVSIRLVFDLEDRIVSDFARLPWELMRADRNAGTPFSISTETAMVRCIDAIRPVSLKEFSGPLKVLLIKSKPTDLEALDIDKESRGIVEMLDGLTGVEVTEVAPIKSAILREMKEKQYHILHYMGHGDFDDAGGALLLEEEDGSTDKVSSAEFTGWLAGNRHLRLVFLNACNSGTTSDEVSLDPYAGVATALMSDGLPAVVAMQFPISDQSAIDFSKTFYQRISQGEPLESAVAEGRKALWQTRSSEWATPVLYLRTKDGYLFGRKDGATERHTAPAFWHKNRYFAVTGSVLVLLAIVGLWFTRDNAPAANSSTMETVLGSSDSASDIVSKNGTEKDTVGSAPNVTVLEEAIAKIVDLEWINEDEDLSIRNQIGSAFDAAELESLAGDQSKGILRNKAAFILGQAYRTGEGVEQSIEQAIKFQKIAAKESENIAIASLELGILFGKRNLDDFPEAFHEQLQWKKDAWEKESSEWFEMAREAGNEQAALELEGSDGYPNFMPDG